MERRAGTWDGDPSGGDIGLSMATAEVQPGDLMTLFITGDTAAETHAGLAGWTGKLGVVSGQHTFSVWQKIAVASEPDLVLTNSGGEEWVAILLAVGPGTGRAWAPITAAKTAIGDVDSATQPRATPAIDTGGTTGNVYAACAWGNDSGSAVTTPPTGPALQSSVRGTSVALAVYDEIDRDPDAALTESLEFAVADNTVAGIAVNFTEAAATGGNTPQLQAIGEA